MSLKEQLASAIKKSMINKEKERLITLRMFSAGIKQQEVDTRLELDDEGCLKVLTTMIKQRKEAFKQFDEAGRSDLANKEIAELKILEEFLPAQLSEEELYALIQAAIEKTGAQGMKDMGKVMSEIRPQIQGKADPAFVSNVIKSRLQGA